MNGEGERPVVSVVVPFRGGASDAARLTASLERLDLREGDEVIVADNSEAKSFGEGSGVRAVRATKERSSYHARNAGAAAAAESWKSRMERASSNSRVGRAEWLVFTDADCVPEPGLIGAYFAEPVSDDVGALAGGVTSDPDQSHFLARYAADRGFLDQEDGVHTAENAAATANLAVRRAAFDEIGGFTEGIRSGGDVDLCRRLVAAGWRIERRTGATVRHLHRESLPDLMRTIARYGAGARWLNERYPGSAPRWPLVPGLMGAAREIAADLARLRFEEAAFRGVDGIGLVAHTIGYSRSNAAR
ncbi:MAG: glycosyltransferase [Actinomycetota bacterium]|nr:glycosyltransferase [Actinomycetota bacterium]